MLNVLKWASENTSYLLLLKREKGVKPCDLGSKCHRMPRFLHWLSDGSGLRSRGRWIGGRYPSTSANEASLLSILS